MFPAGSQGVLAAFLGLIYLAPRASFAGCCCLRVCFSGRSCCSVSRVGTPCVNRGGQIVSCLLQFGTRTFADGKPRSVEGGYKVVDPCIIMKHHHKRCSGDCLSKFTQIKEKISPGIAVRRVIWYEWWWRMIMDGTIGWEQK